MLGLSYQLASLAFPRIMSLEGTDVCLGGRSWELHWPREESLLPFGRTPRGEPQEHHGHLQVQGLPRNILFESSPLLPGLPAMLFAIFSTPMRKEMAA